MPPIQVWHPEDPACTIDLFIRDPIDSDGLWDRTCRANSGNAPCPFAGIDDLIAMKTLAARPLDLRDTEGLRRLQQLNAGRDA